MRKLAVICFVALALGLLGSCSKGFQSQPASAQATATQAPAQSSTPTLTPASSPTPAPTPAPAPSPSPTGLPSPPANAQVFTELQQMAGWEPCDSPGCAGGSGGGTYWMSQNQAAPSLSGNSMELYNSGKWANALWWQKVGANSNATNFLWDFYAQVDESSVTAAQALEFDSFQFVDGYNYMFGSQCDLGIGKWDLWDEGDEAWLPTSIPCQQFAPNVWHHVQWHVQRNAAEQSYTFVTLVVDGTAYSVNQTYSAKYLGWPDNVGVQYQLDVNASGTGYHEWVDESTLTIW